MASTRNHHYLWTVDDELYGGTLQDYCANLRNGHYSGEAVSDLYLVALDEKKQPQVIRVEPERDATVSNDYRHVTLWIGNDRAAYTLDLRA